MASSSTFIVAATAATAVACCDLMCRFDSFFFCPYRVKETKEIGSASGSENRFAECVMTGRDVVVLCDECSGQTRGDSPSRVLRFKFAESTR